ncbi:unnamed protein product [Linum tenue]|uniref:Uncharacterized protein n=1 Tax=Linum tenue TaxID=586396 RepID=A0AAV0RN59_9ROSI|nr:unnamed protein product [Linum tenue]
MVTKTEPESSDFDRETALKGFDETKAGVKGLVDAGIARIPSIFLHSQPNTASIQSTPGHTESELPVIPTVDLQGVDGVKVLT